MRNTQKNHTATVFTDFDGVKKDIEYSSIEELMEKVNKYLMADDSRYEKALRVDKDGISVTSDNLNFYWNCTIAHYCFAKGRIDEVEAFEMMIDEEGGAK